MLNRFLYLTTLALVLNGCADPPPPPTLVEETQLITEVFETPIVYSVRNLDSTAIDAYLRTHPEYRVVSVGIRSFYARRGYQYAWFVNDSLSQSASGFAALINTADTAYREVAALRDRLNELLNSTRQDGRSMVLCDSCVLDLELSLTAQFFRFADKRYGGVIGKDLRELDWFIPRMKKDYAQLLDSLAAGRMDLSPVEPVHPQYAALKAQLRTYYTLDTLVEWNPLGLGERKKLEHGDTAYIVPDIRQRLMLLGDLISEGDTIVLTSTTYDSTLVRAVERFQERHGLMPDGVIGVSVLKNLNVPPRDRIRTLLVNMERLRWVPLEQAPNLILVNIPEFRMHIYEDGVEAWSMDVVVGNSVTRTVIFSDTLKKVVFSPYWGVPESIVRNEILPAMKKNPNYLVSKGMEIVGGTATMPRIRQKPGGSNALGRVKFLFPNTYSIYFHDTPSRGGFAREQRAFSHGCIRLSQPKELAEYLLQDDPEWNKEKIKKAMYGGKEITANLKERRPVTIGYFTAWIDGKQQLNFREDVYGHDNTLAFELFVGAPEPVADLYP